MLHLGTATRVFGHQASHFTIQTSVPKEWNFEHSSKLCAIQSQKERKSPKRDSLSFFILLRFTYACK